MEGTIPDEGGSELESFLELPSVKLGDGSRVGGYGGLACVVFMNLSGREDP